MARTIARARPALSVLSLCAALVISGGCFSASGPAPGDTAAQEQFWTQTPEDERIATLRNDLRATCPLADYAEVSEVAGVAVRFGELVREEYKLTRPVEYNNLAIRMGIKDRGLCFELADDLYVRLRAMRLQTLELHRAIASEGHPIDEHNVVIVTDKGRPMATGMVLDLWRYAGKLRWIAAAQDHHEWHERPITATPPAALVEDDVGPARQ